MEARENDEETNGLEGSRREEGRKRKEKGTKQGGGGLGLVVVARVVVINGQHERL